VFDLTIFQSSDAWVALLTLTVMEIVLGIDNIVFISIMADRLPEAEQPRARRLGLALALILRLGLLFGITWIMRLTQPLFSVLGNELSGRDLVLGLGGLFLIGKATHEIYGRIEAPADEPPGAGRGRTSSLVSVIAQIMLLDVVFSLDSVITAVGMAQEILIMVIATVAAVVVMLLFVNGISGFITRHPSMKMLALSFLLLIGVVLVADALGQHINKGYIYFAMAFSFLVELVNIRVRKNAGRRGRSGGIRLRDQSMV
jgi:predicted tellurium resistance membrane protein TerC